MKSSRVMSSNSSRFRVLPRNLEVASGKDNGIVKQHMPPQFIAIVNAAEADPERLPRIGRRFRVKDQ